MGLRTSQFLICAHVSAFMCSKGQLRARLIEDVGSLGLVQSECHEHLVRFFDYPFTLFWDIQLLPGDAETASPGDRHSLPSSLTRYKKFIVGHFDLRSG